MLYQLAKLVHGVYKDKLLLCTVYLEKMCYRRRWGAVAPEARRTKANPTRDGCLQFDPYGAYKWGRVKASNILGIFQK